jgi:hypothetical protein
MNSPFDILLEPIEKKSTHVVSIGFVDASGRYRIGPPVRPSIKHDNGHLDKYRLHEPTADDRRQLVKWIAILEGSEALCNAQTGPYVPGCSGENQVDANAAYRHFLFGNGADRTINYERFLQEDASAKNLVKDIINDFQIHCSIIGKDRMKFTVTSDSYKVGNRGIAPYPASVNWKRAIGAHFLWVSAELIASVDNNGKIWFDADVTMHMEDRFNFNVGATDVATGIPDSENGQLETSGLGKQYTNFATVTRHTRWEDGTVTSMHTPLTPTERQRMPSDNRRLRNRI